MNPRMKIIAVVAVAAAAVAIALVLLRGRSQPPSGAGPSKGQDIAAVPMSVEGAPKQERPATLEVVAESPPVPALIVDVHDPAKVRDALRRNAWLQHEMQAPLGRGFLGAWAGFLGTRGEDLHAGFSGAIADLFLEKLLAQPFRVVWFGGSVVSGTPALVIPAAGELQKAAYASLDAVAKHGSTVARSCPGEKAPQGAAPAREFSLSRWVVADKSVYAAEHAGLLVLARAPMAVLEALCADLGAMERSAGADLEIGVDLTTPSLDTRHLATLLGAGRRARLALAVQEDRLVPLGIVASLPNRGALGVSGLSDDLLRLVPEDLPVLLTLQLQLPARLERASLQQLLAGKWSGPTRPRQAAVLWVPHGSEAAPIEVAVAWSSAEDEAGLADLFTGPNQMRRAIVCQHVVLSSSAGLLERLRRACAGKSPSLLDAPGPVVQGLRDQGSVALAVQLGRMLALLTEEGWRSEAGVTAGEPLPPEMQQAVHELLELPLLGFVGTAQAAALSPRGFKS